MKAVIICDDLAFATNAASTLERVGRQAGVNVQWTTKYWPINVLNEATMATRALVEASDVHLILFPEHHARSLPSWVFDWLGRWAACRTVRDAALGVIKDGNAGEFATPAFSDLSGFVREHDLSFIVDEAPPVKNPVGIFVRFPSESEVALPVGQTCLAGLATRGSYRGFGINE
jgi:hypothetical protein